MEVSDEVAEVVLGFCLQFLGIWCNDEERGFTSVQATTTG